MGDRNAIEKYGELKRTWFDWCVENAYPNSTIPPEKETLFWWSLRYLLDPESKGSWSAYWAYKVEDHKARVMKSRTVRKAKVAAKRAKKKLRRKRRRK